MNFFNDFSLIGKLMSRKISSRKRQKKYRKKHGSKNDKEYQRKWREENKTKIKEYSKIYWKEYITRPGIKEYRNSEYKKYMNLEKSKELSRLRNEKYKNKDIEAYKDYMRNYGRKRYSEDINYSIKKRLRNRMNQIFKKYKVSGILPQSKIQKHINWKAVCEHLDKTKPENWQEYNIDHVIPLFSYDLTDIEQLKKANSPENLQWLTAEENLKKSNKILY